MKKNEEDVVTKAWPKRKEEERRWKRWILTGVFALIGLLLFWALIFTTPFLPLIYEVQPTEAFFFSTILPVGITSIVILLFFSWLSIKTFP